MRAIRGTFVGTGLLVMVALAWGETPAAVDLDIKAQPMADALNQWAQATGFQLIFPEETATSALVSPEVRGRYAPQAALARILENSGLKFEFLNERTVAIRAVGARTSASGVVEGGAKGNNGALRVANDTHGAHQSDTAGSREMQKVQADSANAMESERKESLQEIVVTAQKREERLQDVPMSISVLSGADLDRSTAEGITEQLNRVPGIAANVYGVQAGGTNLTVRGVTAGGPVFNGSSPVAYYLDSVSFGLVKSAIAPDANAFDLERVEVLRGPQGTLYGASAQNGVVRVLTKDANPSEFEFKARTSGSSTEDGGESYRGDLAVNVPLIDDKLAARAVLGYQDLGGWIDRPNEKDANDAEIRNMRLKLNAQPTDNLSVGLSAWLSRTDYGAPSIGDENGFRDSTHDESIAVDYDAYGMTIGYEFPAFSIVSMTSYLEYSSGGDLEGLSDLVLFSGFDSEVVSQEVILSSMADGPWKWTVGGMYRDAKSKLLQTLPPFINPEAPIDLVDTSESFAAFGELTRKFYDGRIELTGGLRYFEDRVVNAGDVSWLTLLTDGAPGPFVRSTTDFDKLSPRAVVSWHPNPQLTVYTSYAEGFRSGFPQDAHILHGTPQLPPVKEDNLRNYEVGAKGGLLDGRISFDAAIYFIDWEGVQQSLVVPFEGTGVTAVINGESSSGMGVDFGTTFRPVERLEFGVNVSWNDLTMDEDVISAGAILFSKGDRLNFSPEYTIGASADYVFPLGSGGLKGSFSVVASHTSVQDFRTAFEGVRYIAPGDPMTNIRTEFAIRAPENWVATLFVDNVGNEQDSSIRQPFALMPVPGEDQRVRPRTVGIQLEYRY